MNKRLEGFYNIATPEEVDRLKSFQYPDKVSIIEMGNMEKTCVIDIGVGPNRNLEDYVKNLGCSYIALDINKDFLDVRKKSEMGENELIQADAKNLPLFFENANERIVHERFVLMNMKSDEDKKKAVREAMRIAGREGRCIFIDYDWNSFKAQGAVEEFGKLSRVLLSKMGVDVNFAARSKEFIENEANNLWRGVQVSITRYERPDKGDYGELKGNVNSLNCVVQELNDMSLVAKWNDMKAGLESEFAKSEKLRTPFTPPAVVAVKVKSE